MNTNINWQKQILIGFLFFVLSLALFFQRNLFFGFDEWSILYSLASNDLKSWLLQTHCGQFFPIGKALFYLQLLFFGDNYSLYLIFDCAAHALNVLLFFMLLSAFFPFFISLFVSLVYLISFTVFEASSLAINLNYFLSTGLILFSVIQTQTYLRTGKRSSLALSFLSCVFGIFTFGMALISPILNAAFALVTFEKTNRRRFFLALGLNLICFCCIAAIFIYFSRRGVTGSFHQVTGSQPMDLINSYMIVSKKFLEAISYGLFSIPFKYLFFLPKRFDEHLLLISVTGTFTALVFFLYALGTKRFLVGSVAYFVSIGAFSALPALARADAGGIRTCLTLKYQIFTLAIIFFAFALLFKSLYASSRRKSVLTFVLIIFSINYVIGNIYGYRETRKHIYHIRDGDASLQQYTLLKQKIGQNVALTETEAEQIFDQTNPNFTKQQAWLVFQSLF